MHTPTVEEIENFARRLESLLGSAFKVEANKEVTNLFGLIKDTFDLVVFKKNKPIIAVEYKSFFYGVAYKLHKDWFYNRMQKLGIPYAILYYGKDDDLFFYSKSCNSVQFMSLSDAILAITNSVSWGQKPTADEIYADTNFPDVDMNNSEFEEYFRIASVLPKLIIEENIQYDDSQGLVSFIPEIEDKFFKLLLPDEEQEHICRYTSINNIFLSLKEKNHCMLSITCMNDKGELTYADKLAGYYIYADSDENVAHDNNCFILSCCKEEKSDDLTMWRLYGDDAQGCCIQYQLIPTRIDNSKFFFAPVSYGGSKNHHLQLEYVKALLNANYHGWSFHFNRWHIWKHFFKSYLFRDEHEYRLLYIADVGDDKDIYWIRDNTNGIVSRIKTFDCVESDQFPLAYEGVIIGPKCPEQDSMITQLRFMNLKQGIINSKRRNAIRSSNIIDYR